MENKYLKFLEEQERIYTNKDLTIEEQVEQIFALNKSYLLSLTKNNKVATIAIYDLITTILNVDYKKTYVEKYCDVNSKLLELIKIAQNEGANE